MNLDARELSDVIAFKKDVLVTWVWLGPQQRTDPGDKGRASPLEAIYFLVGILMDKK